MKNTHEALVRWFGTVPPISQAKVLERLSNWGKSFEKGNIPSETECYRAFLQCCRDIKREEGVARRRLQRKGSVAGHYVSPMEKAEAGHGNHQTVMAELAQHYPLIATLRGKGMTWQEIANELQRRHKVKVTRQYVSQVFRKLN